MLDHLPICRSAMGGLLPGAEICAGATPTPKATTRKAGLTVSSLRTTAFTLIEMMVVMGIILILVALAVPATTSLLRGLQVGQNGQLVESQLDLARQAALSNNRSVEVRLCQVNGKFSAIMPLLIMPTVNTVNLNQPVYQALSKATFIDDSVLIDKGTTLSSLISPTGADPIAPVTNYSNPPLGSFGQNYKYVSFKFKPDGTTDLDLSKLWFLTVHNATDGDGGAVPPKNFYTIQIDPYNGHVSPFRP